MFKITALALVIALCNAEKEGSSRLLLQAQGPAPPVQVPPGQGPPVPPGPPVQQPPTVPVLQQPQPQAPVQPAPYNPYAQQQQAYNPFNAYGSINSANPYCNPMSGFYDPQDCLQFSAFGGFGAFPGNPGIVSNPGFGFPGAAPPAQTPGYNPYLAPGFGMAPPAAAPGSRPSTPVGPSVNNMANPLCNPYSGMYDMQDCMRSQYGFWW